MSSSEGSWATAPPPARPPPRRAIPSDRRLIDLCLHNGSRVGLFTVWKKGKKAQKEKGKKAQKEKGKKPKKQKGKKSKKRSSSSSSAPGYRPASLPAA